MKEVGTSGFLIKILADTENQQEMQNYKWFLYKTIFHWQTIKEVGHLSQNNTREKKKKKER